MYGFIRTYLRRWQAAVAGAAILLAGCTIYMPSYDPRPAAPAPAPAGDGAAQAIQRLIELNQAGKISDAEMLTMLRALSGGPAVATATPPLQPTAKPATPAPAAAAPAASPDGYQPSVRLSGRLRSIGSDTMDKLMDFWCSAFTAHHPALTTYHEGKGSGTALPALMEGRCDFGAMSRPPKNSEIAEFKTKFGYEPVIMRVAVDAIGVYVHPDNPVAAKGLDLAQLDAVFSADRKRGHAEVKSWGDLGLTGEWAAAPVRVYSRNTASGTYGEFKKNVLQDGNYKPTNIELEGSEALVKAVANDKFGIGYSGIGYSIPEVASVPLAAAAGQEMYPPEAQYAYTSQYPLARFLYLVVNHKSGAKPADLQREFMTFVYSQAGQFLVTKDGFFPVSSKIANEDLGQLK